MSNELIVQFDTGGDDLRGGNDNVHLVLLLQTGAPLRFDNVNNLQKWGNNSSQTVARPLPPTLRRENIVGVRLETTLSGGIGGDNWNLDRLRVRVRLGGEDRVLFEQGGTPLFRFTGNQRVREFRFSTTPLPPVPPVMTRFRPNEHGFKFVNNFTNIFISELNWTTRGLCGGMVYAALDYFKTPEQIPQQDYMPAEGTTLQSYLYNRQVKSIENTLDKWAEFGLNPFGKRNREFFNWGLQAGSGRLGELRERIDRGEPVPLGLQACGDDCECPGGCPGSHQVLAIGYELGRYIGDLGENIEDYSIFVYDPNFPNRVLTLKPNVAGAMYLYKEETSCRWRAYYVDTKYSPSSPPTVRQEPNELIVEFKTGGDDLRGGNDNVHLVLLLQTGAPLRFDNVNNLKRWIDNSSQTIARPLPATLRLENIIGVRLETTLGGGIGGDNWNLDRLRVRVRLGGEDRVLFEQRGTPLFRFTGNQRTREFRFQPDRAALSRVALKVANGQFVCAENGGGRELVANRNAIGPWETFELVSQGGNKIALKAANGQFICAENGGGRELIANRNAIGPWETFELISQGGNKIALKAANGQFICAENGGGRELVANRNAIGPWETFERTQP